MPLLRRSTLIGVVFVLVLGDPGIARAKEINAAELATTGLETSLTRVRGGDRNGALGAFGLTMHRVGYGMEKSVTIRLVNSGSFAAGSRGIQGGVDSALSGGYRVPIQKTHGVVVRGGIQGSFFGNAFLWDSMLEAPQLHLGYQWLEPYDDKVVADGAPARPSGAQLFDVAAKGGYILLGRHNTGDAASRNTSGAPEVGGIGALHLGPFSLHATYTRIFPRHGGDPIDQLEGNFCGHAGSLIVCDSLRYEVGDVRARSSAVYQRSQVSFLGLTVSLGKKKGRLD